MMSLKRLFGKFFSRKQTVRGRFVGRMRVRDVAIQFRMVAGFLGDVNRTHPATIEPCLISVTNPPTAYGQGVVVDAADPNRGLRPLASGDSALTAIYGITVRPFPLQIASSVQQFGGAQFDSSASSVPPTSGVIDVLRSGYIMVKLDAAGIAAQPVKGGAAFIWVAATAGNHTQNQFESTATGGSTVALSGAGSIGTFQGPSDANGVVELAFNI
jgi:hypothetical protein